MRRGTTATHTISTGELDLTNHKVYLTYMQNGRVILERTNSDEALNITGAAIINTISQTESYLFTAGVTVKAQLRWVDANGVAGASNIFNFTVEDVLKEGEINYGTTYDISISGEDSVQEDSTITLTATTSPAGETVDWLSSDDTIATVEDGVVTGVAEGSVTITASLHDHSSIMATKTITVTAAE